MASLCIWMPLLSGRMRSDYGFAGQSDVVEEQGES